MKKSIILTTVNFKIEVHKELRSKSRIGAFLLIHSYIEALLREIFLYPKNYFSLSKAERKMIAKVETEFRFKILLNHLFCSNSIKLKDFKQIRNINRFRNLIAHDLLSYDKSSKEFQDLIDSNIKNCISICETLQKEFIKRLQIIGNMY